MTSPTIQQDMSISYRFGAEDFDPDHWQKQAGTQVLSGGRGGSYRISIDNQAYVLRRYLRGGLMAKLLGDRYLWTSLARTRPLQEWSVVRHAQAHQLPVAPVAAVWIARSGWFYRAAMISSFVDNHGTVAMCLTRSALAHGTWRRIGQLIADMHEIGIDHADLNANNILQTPSEGLCLIDFDKARIRSGSGQWQQNNLARLRRSLDKIARQCGQRGEVFHFSETDWRDLLDGYRR